MVAGTDVVAQQYEKWIYPAPIMDLSHPAVAAGRDDGDPLFRQYQFWPKTGFHEGMDFLVAGCGSNAAARIAYRYPNNRVIGVDLSAASLAHEEYLKQKHNLSNMSLYQGRLEDIASLTNVKFDYIHVTGVLHHLPDPTAGMTALGEVLKPESIMYVMLYGHYGRTGVYMMQKLFQEMGLEQTEESLALVKETLSLLPKEHPILSYMAKANDLHSDNGLVDTFLHKMDRAYRVEDVLALVNDSNLTFGGWSENYMYHANGLINGNNATFQRFSQLPKESLWQAMEVFHGMMSKHSFYVYRHDRSPEDYDVSLHHDDFTQLIPVPLVAQLAEGLPKNPADPYLLMQRKPFPKGALSESMMAFLSHVDGQNSVQDGLDKSGWLTNEPESALAHCRNLLGSLMNMDYLCLRRP